MNTNLLTIAAQLSDDALDAKLKFLAQGSRQMTVALLAPHLTMENHRALLEEAKGMTRRQVDKMVARLAPKPDVPASIRKLPAPRVNVQGAGAVTPAIPSRDEREVMTCLRPQLTTHRPVVAPLSPERYRVQLTIGEEAHDDLRCLQDLMRREIPDGDPAVIVARALQRLRQEVEKKAFAATAKPRPGPPAVYGRSMGSLLVPGPVSPRHESAVGGPSNTRLLRPLGP